MDEDSTRLSMKAEGETIVKIRRKRKKNPFGM